MIGKVLIALGVIIAIPVTVGVAAFGWALWQWVQDPHGPGAEPEDYVPTADYPSERPTSGGLSGEGEDATSLIRPGL